MTPNRLWKHAGGDRARYLALLRQHGYVYERADGATVHTVARPVANAQLEFSGTGMQEQNQALNGN